MRRGFQFFAQVGNGFDQMMDYQQQHFEIGFGLSIRELTIGNPTRNLEVRRMQ